MSLTFKITNADGKKTITVYQDGQEKNADSSHAHFDEIVKGALLEDDSIFALFDPTPQIGDHFDRVTERVSVSNGRVFFDGDEIVESALQRQLLRALDEGDEVEWIALPNFYEKLSQNPNEHSREMLFEWLREHGVEEFTITPGGDLLLYKGVNDDLFSLNGGTAIVDGELVKGRIPNKVGSTVEMPRSKVAHDPKAACSTGLHTATFDFAQGFGSTVIAVVVNPRDVVSVPSHANKVRVCRYTVKEVVKQPEQSVVAKPKDKPKTTKKVSQSNLDKEPVKRALKSRIKEGWQTRNLVNWLYSEYQVNTTKDSIRRFKARHGLS